MHATAWKCVNRGLTMDAMKDTESWMTMIVFCAAKLLQSAKGVQGCVKVCSP